MIVKAVKRLTGVLILGLVSLLPWRGRVWASELLGRFMNGAYTLYLACLAWFLRQLRPEGTPRND